MDLTTFLVLLSTNERKSAQIVKDEQCATAVSVLIGRLKVLNLLR